MSTMRRLSLSLFCIGTLGLIGIADADAQRKNKRKKPVVEEEVAPEAEEAAPLDEPSMQEAADNMDLEPPDGTAGYDEGFYIRDSGDKPNRLMINGRVQSRFSFFSNEGGDERINSHNFSLPLARLAVQGLAHDERVYFKSEVDFGNGQTDLQDFFLDYRIGEKQTRIRVGQFKKPFSRQFLNKDHGLEFADRSIVDAYYGNGRDIGVEVHSGFIDKAEVEWAFGVFNGTGSAGVFQPTTTVDPMTMEETVTGGANSNIPNKVRPAVVGRVGYNANGIDGYSEADLEGGDLRYGVALATMTHFRLGGNTAISRNGVDFVVKQDGVSATGGVYAEWQGAEAKDLEYTGIAGYVQTGYVIDSKWQPALRYALISEEGGDSVQELSAVFNVYKFAHNLKWQNEATLLNTDVGGARRKDYRFRSQVQVGF